MPTPATPSPTPAGDDRNLVKVDQDYSGLGFEDRVRLFWEKNSQLVTIVIVVVLLVIAAKGGWDYFAAQRERVIEQAYAAASGKTELQAFIAANPTHPLAAAAQLRLGDEAYAAGNFADAVTAYDAAAGMIKTGPLASRARMGSAMAKLEGGRAAEGEAALKAIAGDVNEFKAYRAEADYHLATLAFANHDAAGVKASTEQLMQVDPSSPWLQRVMQLRAESAEPAAPAAVPSPAAPGSPKIKLPGAGK